LHRRSRKTKLARDVGDALSGVPPKDRKQCAFGCGETGLRVGESAHIVIMTGITIILHKLRRCYGIFAATN
jgi:hypothetical protein